MELDELILLLVIANCITLAFIFFLVGRWCVATDKRLNDIEKRLCHIMRQSSIMFLNYLVDFKERLIKQEKYDEVIELDKLIKEEMERQEKEIGGSKQN